jgi:hypothetical protein
MESPIRPVVWLCGLVWVAFAAPCRGSLGDYDAAILADDGQGLAAVAKLTAPVTFNDTNRAAFNFGNTSGDVTIEFVLEGDPVAGGPNGYLAVGSNATSNLRFEQWSDTGQLGFTQLGVADYLFSPVVPTPTDPVHIAYVWKSGVRTMEMFLNGSFAGSSSGVDAGFAMPTGQGWLGNNAANSEGMVGTIHRVTVYDEIITAAALQRHADAYNDILRAPVVVSFTANPATIFTPGSSTLTWNVADATSITINGADVTALPGLSVSPAVTTAYELVATNDGGTATARTTVTVNPPPVINGFTASRPHTGAGEPVTLSWSATHGQTFSIAPGIGDVTASTSDGSGSVEVSPAATTTYTLTVANAFGSTSANAAVHVVQPAAHLVISEFMADNESTIADDDGAFTDWIEIFNPTASPVNLSGWFLTDEPNDPRKWAFPDVTLAPGAFLLVRASGNDRANPAGPLHTNFRLDKDGDYLALVGPGSVVMHQFQVIAQEADVSLGLLGGDPTLVLAMGAPTPGAANDATPPPPARVEFSPAGGTFTANFDLTLTSPTPGAEIRYTTNGAVPDAATGTIYTAPIAVTSTRRFRAVAIKDGRVSRVSGASFIKVAAELASYSSSLPILVI